MDKETETTEMTAYIVAKKDERALMKDMNVKIRECIMDKNTWMYCVQILKRVGRTSYISQLPVNLPEHQNIDNPSCSKWNAIFLCVEINLPLYTGNVEKHVHPG